MPFEDRTGKDSDSVAAVACLEGKRKWQQGARARDEQRERASDMDREIVLEFIVSCHE